MEVWMCNMLTLLFGYNWFIGDNMEVRMCNMLTLLFGYNWFIAIYNIWKFGCAIC